MKKVVVLLLLCALVRDNAGAEAVPSSPASVGGNNNGAAPSASVAGMPQPSNNGSAPLSAQPDPAKSNEPMQGNAAAAPAVSPSGTTVTVTPSDADVKAQWTASLSARNPFVPFGSATKAPEKETKSGDDWASKKADELNLYSVTKYPTYTEVSIEVIETKKRCWVRSDKESDKVPFKFVGYDEAGKVLTVENTITKEMMSIRQQEKKKDTSRRSGSSSYGGYDDYDSSYYDDDFLYGDFN